MIGRWFNKSVLRRACRVTDRKKRFHCFRHTFTTLTDRGAAVETITRTINGHSPGTAVDDESYVRKGTLLECQTAIEQLDFPMVDHEPYVSASGPISLRPQHDPDTATGCAGKAYRLSL